MTIEERLARLEKSLGKQDDLVRELRDAVTVTAQLEAAQSRMLKEHTLWLASHERGMAEHNEAMKNLDLRISQLVSGFGEFMRSRP
jgi:uncharacterized coiled-coil protein SlyX